MVGARKNSQVVMGVWHRCKSCGLSKNKINFSNNPCKYSLEKSWPYPYFFMEEGRSMCERVFIGILSLWSAWWFKWTVPHKQILSLFSIHYSVQTYGKTHTFKYKYCNKDSVSVRLLLPCSDLRSQMNLYINITIVNVSLSQFIFVQIFVP